MPLQKGSSSTFAAAAKVLFDSAQRVGAVEPLEQSTKQYAHQLKKIQSQSKKRGGSLGGVSYKVAEFLAAQRTPAPHPLSRHAAPLDRSIARKVPLIDIPPAPAPKVVSAKLPLVAPAKSESSASRSVPPLSVDPAPRAEPRVVARPRKPSPKPEAPPAGDEQSAETAAAPAEEVLILEDKPLFEVRPVGAEQPPAVTAVLQSVVTAVPAAASPPVKRARPIISVPIAPDVAVAEAEAESAREGLAEAAAAPLSFSVDVWEQQREKEMERLQRKQEEEEQHRLAHVREEAHKTLGLEWVSKRSGVDTFEAEVTAGGKLLREVYYASSAAAATTAFQKMVDAGAKAASLLPAGVSCVAFHIQRTPLAERVACRATFLEVVDKAKLSEPLKRKVHLLVSSNADFLAAYAQLTPAEKLRLDPATIVKAARLLTVDGQWEQAIELAKQSRTNFRSNSDSLDLTLLRSCRWLEEGPRKEVVAYATQSLTEQGRLGKAAKMLIAGAEAGTYRRTLLKQIAASADVDEGVYAELILRSAAEQTDALLTEMASRGLNREDPVVLGAIALKKLEDGDPATVFKEVDSQIARIGIRPSHVAAAIKAAALHPSEGTLRQAVAVVMTVPAEGRAVGMRKLFPLLYQHGMTKEIIEVAEKTNETVSVAGLVPQAVAFVNEALIAQGRAPLSAVRTSDIGVAHLAATARAGAADKTDTRLASTVTDLSGLTEKMLLYAKERQWARALEAVTGLPPSIRADASAVTLLYNCALSAAVERPETVKQVYALMQARSVSENATTVNTVLSSLSKSAMWKDALPFFAAIPPARRDNNTYLVHFALLGKQGLWKEATEAYDEMRQAVAKPPAPMFSLVINTTSSQDWQATLRVFQDMLKLHGSTVKDSVVSQVFRCLEQHNKASEIAKLEKEMAKRKKKKK